MMRLISQAPGGQSLPQQKVGLASVDGVGLAVNSEESDESAEDSAAFAALILTWSARAVEGRQASARYVSGKIDSMLVARCY